MPQDNRTPIQKLTDAHARLMKVHVSGEESVIFAEALLSLTGAINDLSEEPKDSDDEAK